MPPTTTAPVPPLAPPSTTQPISPPGTTPPPPISTPEPQRLPEIAQEPENREARIRERAYRNYEARGRSDGDDLRDWLEAEAEEQQASARRDSAPD